MSGAFSQQTARLIFEFRDGEACFFCQRGLRWADRGFGWSLHHREPRKMGGRKDAHLSRPSNGLTLCGSGTTGCHGRVESDRDWALSMGLLVSAFGSNRPVNIPVRRGDGSLWFLTDDGRAIRCEDPGF